jgi:cell division inhibitor SepF
MHYLGLGPDEEYDDYDLLGSHPAHEEHNVGDSDRPEGPLGSPSLVERPALRTLASAGGDEPARATATNGHSPRPAPGGVAEAPGKHAVRVPAAGPPRSAAVRPLAVPPSTKPHVVAPASFVDAQEIADLFRYNAPVIVNLQGVERDLMRRIIDFASGLCYGLGGQMERVASHVYLLTPSDVEVTPEERRRLRDRGYEA